VRGLHYYSLVEPGLMIVVSYNGFFARQWWS